MNNVSGGLPPFPWVILISAASALIFLIFTLVGMFDLWQGNFDRATPMLLVALLFQRGIPR